MFLFHVAVFTRIWSSPYPGQIRLTIEAVLLTKDWWRCTVMDSGELCAMIHSVKLTLTLFVDSWDTREHLIMTTSACEK